MQVELAHGGRGQSSGDRRGGGGYRGGVVAMAAVEVEVVDQPGLVSHDTLNSEVCVIFAVGKV